MISTHSITYGAILNYPRPSPVRAGLSWVPLPDDINGRGTVTTRGRLVHHTLSRADCRGSEVREVISQSRTARTGVVKRKKVGTKILDGD